MNEWGIPDWRNPTAYGDVGAWTMERWRWEFFRRRDDLRAAFDDALAGDDPETFSDRTGHPGADSPGFAVRISNPERFGYLRLPNPRIGNQPQERIVPVLDSISIRTTPGSGGRRTAYSYDPNAAHMEVAEGQLGVCFDLDRPILPQLEIAERVLRDAQEKRHGRLLDRKYNTAKWLGYLRALDARADNQSWNTIAQEVLPVSNTTRDASAGRRWFLQAQELCFKF